MRYIEKELENLKDEVLEMWTLVYSQLNRAGRRCYLWIKTLATRGDLPGKKSERF